METASQQPTTGSPCTCKQGQQRNNCTACEGTGNILNLKPLPRKPYRVHLDEDAAGTLNPTGWTTEEATSPEGAIEQALARREGHRPAAAFVDIGKPHSNGNPCMVQRYSLQYEAPTDPPRPAWKAEYFEEGRRDWRS